MIFAQWPKKCPGCGDEIDEGDLIGLVDSEWVCSECVDSAGGEDGDQDD